MKKTNQGRPQLNLAAVAILFILLALTYSSPASGEETPDVASAHSNELTAHRLPPELRWAQDIRFKDSTTVWIAAGPVGVVEFSLQSEILRPAIAPLPRSGPYRYASRLAVTDTHLVAAASIRSIFWSAKNSPADVVDTEHSFDSIVDLAANQGKVAILGARRDPDGAWAPNGVIGWWGTIAGDELELKPFYVSSSGPGASSLARCGILELGQVRFLRDGSFLFVPGVEQGISLYDRQGKLHKSWPARTFDFESGCELDKEVAAGYLASFALRHEQWINHRRVLDDILPLEEGPGLVIRSRQNGLTQWELIVLDLDAEPITKPIPLSSPFPFAHLKGDVSQDGSIVYLVSDVDRDGPDRRVQIFVDRSPIRAEENSP